MIIISILWKWFYIYGVITMRMRVITAVTAVLLGFGGLAQADDLIIYSGRSDKFVEPVLEAFKSQTGIDYVLRAGSSTALLNKLRLEGTRSPADLYISNDAGNLYKGAEMGLFDTIPDAIRSVIPKNYQGENGQWLGLSARARVLVVNTKAPGIDFVDSIFDLADPRLKDRLATTHSGNESYIAGVTAYLLATSKARVKQWLSGVKENVNGSVFNKHSKIVKAVANGEKAVGLVNHYYVFRHLDQHPDAPIKIIFPDQGKDQMGVAWNVAGAAIVKHSKKKAAAQKLVEFMASQEGQKLFAEVNREYPTRSGVPAAKQVPPSDSYKVADVPMDALGKNRDETLDLIEALGMP